MKSRAIQNLSIRHKVSGLVLVSVLLALVLCCAAFCANHYLYAKESMAQEMGSLAEVLGANAAAALVFDDPDTAGQLLSSLRRQPVITSAQVHDSDGALFCQYSKDDASTSSSPRIEPGVTTRNGELMVCRGILDEGDELVGYITLSVGLDVINDRLARYAAIMVVVMAVSLVLSLSLAWPLQKSLTGPLLALADAAETAGEHEDYSIRVEQSSKDEIGTLCSQFNRMLSRVEESEREIKAAHELLEERVEQRTAELSRANESLNAEISERQRAEEELEQSHRDLVDAARRAGMAEIATGVLHNVGNVLNSVNISASTIGERLSNPRRRQIDRVIELLEANRDRIGEYLTVDGQGKHVPAFLAEFADSLAADDRGLIDETRTLAENIDHIKAIIATQQSFAGSVGLLESLDLNSAIEDALRLNATSFTRHSVAVVRELGDLPLVVVDKPRLMQIVVNLIKNAKEALAEHESEKKVLTLRSYSSGDEVVVEVADNGIGIPAEGLVKIFNHGFTTKKNGHGFGLHSCANAARQMGGSLTVASEGLMRGATFTLTLPMQAREPAAETVS